ncbi:MAG TPA: bifunctional DNA-formamidopyrimidine glycosylase/DNA-(apurinic or apyrimidinic site) lyase [Sporichthya sp.]|nr:bifunctional DNA-formamidopyrimidine glycosylase/DNA-(apurinic or apyrimidinic site) lyase [Sporichthya sp.]
MPELPEVEVVRRGAASFAVGRTIATAEVHHPRSVRRHVAGGADLAARLAGVTVTGADRRGKFLWLPLDTGEALLVHLGMSGQLRVQPPAAPPEKHLRVRLAFADEGPDLRFVDQRTFGGLSVEPLVPGRGGLTVPQSVAHIALDPLEPGFDADAFRAGLRAKRTGLKRALLDQTLISGIGNIYADEALWRARLHYARPTETLRPSEIDRVLTAAVEVMTAALAAGGTSFDSLYVNVNGESGYFDRSLDVYGREGRECARCGSAIRRDAFMNRSSFSCPRCQPRPRRAHW